ncbi:MAG: ATP-dependent RNA helicase HrpA [Cycloclasticus sp.]|nr:MAG: ATP-dependent RNA helicase HrpA [Cycloclasticus sp.]
MSATLLNKDPRSLITQCLSKQQHGFTRLLKRVYVDKSSGRDEKLAKLVSRIEQSIKQVEQRRLYCPTIHYPDLPISEKRQDIADLIRENQVVILCGETGSGKTTQLPKICLELGRGFKGQIGHTQPRRLAAITVAQRIADELKTELGQQVGYKIRFQGKEQPSTLVKLMTDGILLAEIKSDPFLSHYDTLILDEAHERSLNIDFLLGYMKWLLPKRSDLKLIVTSATIDPDRFSKHFDNAPVINVSGRTYPVEMRYNPVGVDSEQNDQDMLQGIINAADELHRDRAGDILVFLSGEREIREAADALRKHHPKGYDILPLYSRLSGKEQAEIFKRHKKPRIVLATNVAETSLTVPGIRCVIDTGVVRISRFSQRSKIQQLPIEPISQASANQRSGRCGREAPGICIRLYSEDDFKQRSEFTQPEILRTNLASVILQMKSLKLADIEQFPFLQAPPDKMIRSGVRSLHELGALDENEKLTDIGKRLTHFPLDPQLGRMVLAAEEHQCLDEVLTIVSALSIQDPRERPVDKAKFADEKHKAFQNESSDFLAFLTLWRESQTQKRELSNNQFRKYCREYFLSYMRLKDWQDIRKQLLDVVKRLKIPVNKASADDDAVHKALMTGLVTRIGFKHEQAEYIGARQLKFHIHPASSLFKKKPQWIMVAEQVETTRVYGRTVAAVKPEWIEKAAPHLIKRQYYQPHWSKSSGQAMAYEQVVLFGLVISKGRSVPLSRTDKQHARELFIRHGLVERDMACFAPFFKHNEQLLESLEYDQQKGRRVDLLVDEQVQFDFYDEKLPPHIMSLAALNKWLKTSVKPDLLRLSLEDISSPQQSDIDPNLFPDTRQVNGVVVGLTYRFEPGHEEDGVTADIILAQLNQLSSEAFEWLVPGLYAEKLNALIKSLPKQLRKHFVPVPNTVEACLQAMDYANGDLLKALVNELNKVTRIGLKVSDFDLSKLDSHLLMNFRLVGEKGDVIHVSRNFNELKKQYGEKAGQQFQSSLKSALSKSGLKNWQFDDIPKQQTIEYKGQIVQGFPALLDEKNAVGLTLVDSEAEAKLVHQAGLNRLFRLKFSKELKKLSRQSALSTAQAFSYQQLRPHPYCALKVGDDVFDDIVFQLVSSLLGDRDIRSEAEFNQAVRESAASIYAKGYELSETVMKVLLLYQTVKTELNQWQKQSELFDDASHHLSCLFYQGFIRYVPVGQLALYPRYLRAIQVRLEKARGQLDKDASKASQAQYFEKKFWAEVKGQSVNPELESFRWLLEEFRISLFAQQIKTKLPASEKRLTKAWNNRQA